VPTGVDLSAMTAQFRHGRMVMEAPVFKAITTSDANGKKAIVDIPIARK